MALHFMPQLLEILGDMFGSGLYGGCGYTSDSTCASKSLFFASTSAASAHSAYHSAYISSAVVLLTPRARFWATLFPALSTFPLSVSRAVACAPCLIFGPRASPCPRRLRGRPHGVASATSSEIGMPRAVRSRGLVCAWIHPRARTSRGPGLAPRVEGLWFGLRGSRWLSPRTSEGPWPCEGNGRVQWPVTAAKGPLAPACSARVHERAAAEVQGKPLAPMPSGFAT